MSKTLRKAIIALVILAVGVGGYFTAKYFIDKNKADDTEDADTNSTVTLAEYNPDNVVKIEGKSNEEFELVRGTSGTWVCKKPEDVTATNSAVNNIVTLLNKMTGQVVYPKGEYKGDLGQFGLEKPAELKLTFADGTTKTFFTGKQSPTGTGYYLMTDDSDAIYLVASVYMRKLILERTDLIAGNLVEFADTAKISEISIEKDGGKVVDFKADFSTNTDGASKEWYLVYPINCKANPSEVSGLIDTSESLSVYDTVEGEGADLSKYGLDVPKLKVTFKDNKGTQSYELGKKDGNYYYCTINGGTSVFRVSSEYITFIDNSALSYAYAYPFFENYTGLTSIDIEIFGDVNEKHKMTFQFGKSADGKDIEVLTLDGQASKETDKDGKEIYNYDYEFKGITTYCYALQVDNVEEEQQYEKGELLCRITYTRRDGSKAVVECFERDEGTMYLYLDGQYFGGSCDKWRVFSEEDHQGIVGTIKAYKKLLNDGQ